MTLHRKNLIDGEWLGEAGSRNINPSNTNDVVGEYASAGPEEAKQAIAAAKAAFPAWSRSGPLARHAVLKKTSDEIMARKDEIGRTLGTISPDRRSVSPAKKSNICAARIVSPTPSANVLP
ncbi:aldehyde dehydrogenase family protein, partial [Mesorhizobium sp.]|uniref:aldehyde dehydrogenase family protein n=1 Tax=Mesorhizobium sp. TaxID=1871066 RepID=UPI0025C4B061